MSINAISVRTHVARDLLQSAALFKTDKLVVWEYVANGLQYREPGTSAVVKVSFDSPSKQIIIDDNGRGMDRRGLQNFFVMHGENEDRKAGRRGRGRFGTGKSAAFGIASTLRVSSIRDGLRNTVELTRLNIEAAGENEIPVKTVEQDVPTDEPNGTVVTISKLNLKRLDQRAVINFIERHLSHWPDKPVVTVNNHPCEYTEPSTSQTRKVKPSDEIREILGDVELTLKVAKGPLSPEMQGVAINANSVWLETTLAGAEGQPMAQYIFGDIDIPALDDDNSPIPAFDMSRSMQLNRSNELVQTVLAFVGLEVDRLRRELVTEDKARKADEDSKKLDREARLIADMINQDFQEFSDRVSRVKAKSGTGHDLGRSMGETEGESTSGLTRGKDINATEDDTQQGPGRGDGEGGGGGGGETPNRGPLITPDSDGKAIGRSTGKEGKPRRSRGGFGVEFKEMGADSPRANYVPNERTIYINLEHPQIEAAKGNGSVEDPIFRRLAYEVGFSEYAIALATEMNNNGEFIEPSDAMVEIRDAINRMARRAAALYAA